MDALARPAVSELQQTPNPSSELLERVFACDQPSKSFEQVCESAGVQPEDVLKMIEVLSRTCDEIATISCGGSLSPAADTTRSYMEALRSVYAQAMRCENRAELVVEIARRVMSLCVIAKVPDAQVQLAPMTIYCARNIFTVENPNASLYSCAESMAGEDQYVPCDTNFVTESMFSVGALKFNRVHNPAPAASRTFAVFARTADVTTVIDVGGSCVLQTIYRKGGYSRELRASKPGDRALLSFAVAEEFALRGGGALVAVHPVAKECYECRTQHNLLMHTGCAHVLDICFPCARELCEASAVVSKTRLIRWACSECKRPALMPVDYRWTSPFYFNTEHAFEWPVTPSVDD